MEMKEEEHKAENEGSATTDGISQNCFMVRVRVTPGLDHTQPAPPWDAQHGRTGSRRHAGHFSGFSDFSDFSEPFQLHSSSFSELSVTASDPNNPTATPA